MRSSAAFCVLLALAASYALAAPISSRGCNHSAILTNRDNPPSSPSLPYRIGIVLPNSGQPTHKSATSPLQSAHPVDFTGAPYFPLTDFPNGDGIGPALYYPGEHIQERDKRQGLWEKYVEKVMARGGDNQPKAFDRAKEVQVPHARNSPFNSEANQASLSDRDVGNALANFVNAIYERSNGIFDRGVAPEDILAALLHSR